jgi:hypothetical protein
LQVERLNHRDCLLRRITAAVFDRSDQINQISRA